MNHLRTIAAHCGLAALLIGAANRLAQAQALKIVGALSNFDCYNTTPGDCEGFEIEIEGIHKEQVIHTYAGSAYGAPTLTDGGTAAAPSAIIRYHSNTTVVHSGGVTHFGVTLAYYTQPGTILRRWLPAATVNVPNPPPAPYVLPSHQSQLNAASGAVHDFITNDAPDGVTIFWILPYGLKVHGRHVSLEELMPNNPVALAATPMGSGSGHKTPILLEPGVTWTNDEAPEVGDSASGVLWYEVYADVVTGSKGKNSHQPGALIGRALDSTDTILVGSTPANVALSDASVFGTQDVLGQVTLDGGALPGGTVVSLSADNASVSLPASVTVPANQFSALFAIQTSAVATQTTVHITAMAGGVSQSASFVVLPPNLRLLYLALASVGGGRTTTGTVFLTTPAPAGGVAVALTSDSSLVEVPASVTVGAGSVSASFNLPTHPVTAPVAVNLTATSGGVLQSARLRVVPDTVSVGGMINLEGLAPNAPDQSVTITFRPADGSASFDRTVAIGQTSAFRFDNIPAKNYVLHFQGKKYLAANIAANAANNNVLDLTAALSAGDANSDNSVDATDFGILVGAYNGVAALSGSGYAANADFKLDGSVDATDFGLLVGNYGSVGAD